MCSKNELIYTETIPKKYTPNYGFYTKYIFKDIKTDEKYELLFKENELMIYFEENIYCINCNFINQHILSHLLEMMVSSKLSSFHFDIGSIKNSNEKVGHIEYRFGYYVVDMGYKYRPITKIEFNLNIVDSFILFELHIIASTVIRKDNEDLTEVESKNFDETFTFRIPFDIVPSFFNLNHSLGNFFHEHWEENKNDTLLKKIQNGFTNFFTSSNIAKFFERKKLNSYKKINNMEIITNNYGGKLYIFKNKKNEFLSVNFTLNQRFRVVKISDNYSFSIKQKNHYETIGYEINTNLLNASQIKNILIQYKEPLELPIKVFYEGNLGTLNSQSMPTRKIENIKFEIKIDKEELNFDIDIGYTIELDEASSQLKKEHIENFQFDIPLNYVPELLDMNEKEKDVFSLYFN